MSAHPRRNRKAPLAGKNSPARQARADGALTSAAIIEVAGSLFGERGYDGTTGKAICEKAGVNMAAVNYHFGSRDGLYEAVLHEVHRRVMNLEFMQDLALAEESPQIKLRTFLRQMVAHVLDHAQWPLRVWARELLAPSALLDKTIRRELNPKVAVLASILSEITGVAVQDPAMPQMILCVMAPFLALLIVGRKTATPIQPVFACDAQVLADRLWVYAIAGLEATTGQ